MTDRFDNLSTEDLLAREMETRVEANDLKLAVRARLEAEWHAKITVGEVYEIDHSTDRLAGRLMQVGGIVAGIPDFRRERPFEVRVWGRLNGKSKAGDGWTIKTQSVLIERLRKQD